MNPWRTLSWARDLGCLALLSLVLSNCGSGADSSAVLLLPDGIRSDQADYLPDGDPLLSLAQVNSVEILVLESFPVQIQAQVTGSLPSGCAQLDEPQIQRQDDRFTVVLTTTFTQDICTMELRVFEQAIPLDGVGLTAGIYEVEVNGQIASFELTQDNTL